MTTFFFRLFRSVCYFRLIAYTFNRSNNVIDNHSWGGGARARIFHVSLSPLGDIVVNHLQHVSDRRTTRRKILDNNWIWVRVRVSVYMCLCGLYTHIDFSFGFYWTEKELHSQWFRLVLKQFMYNIYKSIDVRSINTFIACKTWSLLLLCVCICCLFCCVFGSAYTSRTRRE